MNAMLIFGGSDRIADMNGKTKTVVIPALVALRAAGRNMVCTARLPGFRGYVEMASRLLLLSLILILPVLLMGRVIVMLDFAEFALVAPIVTIGVIALVCSDWFARSSAGMASHALVESLYDPFGQGMANVRRLRARVTHRMRRSVD